MMQLYGNHIKQETNKKKIVHIYYNTSGNSGLYLNPIRTSLASKFEQVFLVNYYYPLVIEEFKRYFFRLTEKNENNPHKLLLKIGFFRKVIRFVELQSANRKILNYLKKAKPDAVNYSLTNMPGARAFLKRMKKMIPDCKLIVTCHDVVPFHATSIVDYEGIYRLADYLLVHTMNAKAILENQYGVIDEQIIYHPFPLIDLSLLQNRTVWEKEGDAPAFLFIGVMRREKGVQTLVNAWSILGPEFPATLHIAGYKPDDVTIDTSRVESFPNFKITMKSLSDGEYLAAVEEADYVVFPYSQVGNSGVLSSIVSLGKVPITTKLPTFLESDYCMEDLSCEPDNPEELAMLIRYICQNHKKKYSEKVQEILTKLEVNKNEFADLTLKAYEKVLCKEESQQ